MGLLEGGRCGVFLKSTKKNNGGGSSSVCRSLCLEPEGRWFNALYRPKYGVEHWRATCIKAWVLPMISQIDSDSQGLDLITFPIQFNIS